jgi:hypothetical protein
LNEFNSFVEKRLLGSVSLLAPLLRNKLLLFKYKAPSATKDAMSPKLSELKSDCNLFSRLYIACQSRDGGLDDFFVHENHSLPPALSQGGNLRFGTKSDLLSGLLSVCDDSTLSTDIAQLSVDLYILGGAVITQIVQPACCKTFQDYGEKMFLPYVKSIARKTKRVDIVFDTYITNSLKTTAREKRGTGI